MATANRGTAKSASARTSPTRDAIALLKADHTEVRQLFARYDKLCAARADDDSLQSLAENICAMLTAHTMIEEEIFYPAARSVLEDQALLDEAEVEHASAKDLIAQLMELRASAPLFDAKVKVLGEYIQHHVKEEEGELFPKLRKTGLDLKSLAAEMATRKEQILEVTSAETESSA
jgi:hemerythrin-like domain-containing protein